MEKRGLSKMKKIRNLYISGTVTHKTFGCSADCYTSQKVGMRTASNPAKQTQITASPKMTKLEIESINSEKHAIGGIITTTTPVSTASHP